MKQEVYRTAMMPYILVGVLSFLVALALGLFLGYRYRKNAAEKEIRLR